MKQFITWIKCLFSKKAREARSLEALREQIRQQDPFIYK